MLLTKWLWIHLGRILSRGAFLYTWLLPQEVNLRYTATLPSIERSLLLLTSSLSLKAIQHGSITGLDGYIAFRIVTNFCWSKLLYLKVLKLYIFLERINSFSVAWKISEHARNCTYPENEMIAKAFNDGFVCHREHFIVQKSLEPIRVCICFLIWCSVRHYLRMGHFESKWRVLFALYVLRSNKWTSRQYLTFKRTDFYKS